MPLKGCCVSISDEEDNASFANYSVSRLEGATATPTHVACIPLHFDSISIGNSSSLENSSSTIISFSSGFDDDSSYFQSTSTLSFFEDDDASELMENLSSVIRDQSEIQVINADVQAIKKVRFGHVAVREYALTIGNTTRAEKCPLQLSWEYREKKWKSLSDHIAHTLEKRKGIQKLSLDQRRDRLALVQGLSTREINLLEQIALLEKAITSSNFTMIDKKEDDQP
jgi:hypothetical protein